MKRSFCIIVVPFFLRWRCRSVLVDYPWGPYHFRLEVWGDGVVNILKLNLRLCVLSICETLTVSDPSVLFGRSKRECKGKIRGFNQSINQSVNQLII